MAITYYIQWLVHTCVIGTCVVGTVGLVCYVVFFVLRLCKFYQNHTIKNHKINVHSIYCVLIGWPAEVRAAYTWSYYTRDRSASKRSVCLAERYNSLSRMCTLLHSFDDHTHSNGQERVYPRTLSCLLNGGRHSLNLVWGYTWTLPPFFRQERV